MNQFRITRYLFVLLVLASTCSTWAERNERDVPDEGTLDEDSRAVLNRVERPDSIKPEIWKLAVDRYKIKMGRNANVEFFGVVVDQKMQPLEGVQVTGFVRAYDYTYLEKLGSVASDQTEIEWAVTTDKNGRFSVSGLNGLSLHIRKLEKNGFLAPVYNKYFRLSEKQFRTNLYEAREDQPVVFKMWAEDAAKARNLIEKSIKLDGLANGTEYRLNLETGVHVDREENLFDIGIKVQAALPADSSSGKYDWSYSLIANEGGFVATDEDQAFEAPENGYVSPFSVVFPSAHDRWSRKDQRKFYVRTRGGDLYAVIELTVYAYRTGKILVRINSVANLDGSRNLANLR